ncbi:MAG: DUF4153 domain-containing protein [Fretibacterium sp.]|nr:DUF4153 domain-containing protein [Fretibacterium sp.]
MYSIDRKRYLWVTISALLQGLLLGAYAVAWNGLHDGLALPGGFPVLAVLYNMPLSIVVIVPFVFWLAQEHWGRRLSLFLSGLSLVLAIFYIYRLWSVYPTGSSFYVIPSQKLDLLRACIAVFLLIPFFQCRIATWSWRVPYSEIFFQFCRNLFLLFQAAIVMAVFWGLLLTASLLFDIVGLNFVPWVLFNPLVAVPLSSLTIAVSISVALKHPGIDSLGRWILSVLAWLLPPFSVLSLVFIACLPWSGLRTLWSTGQASSLIMLLQLGTILLANAAWLDGARPAFPNRFLNALAQVSLLCLPVYTAVCLYSLGLRIHQYGLSADRIQAGFSAVVLGIWGIGYAGAVILRRWPSAIGRVNIASTLVMTLIVVAMNSPVLDPYRLAANNQADRLLGGQIAPEDFDYLYMRFSLGCYGTWALERIEESEHPRLAAIRRRIDKAMEITPQEYLQDVEEGVAPSSQRREILSQAAVYPEGRRLPAPAEEYLIQEWGKEDSPLRSVRRSSEIAFAFVPLFEGTEPPGEDLLVLLEGMGILLRVMEDSAQTVGFFSSSGTEEGERFSLNSLSSPDIAAAAPQFRDLLIGDRRYRILPLPEGRSR